MTLRLLVMRHGKSDWSANYGADHERPLASRGVQAARQMGRLVSKGEQLPALIVSSTAVRARRTAALFIEGAQSSIPTEFSANLYESTPQRVLAEIHQVKAASPLMLVGHEPTWSQMVSELIGGGNINFPTAAIARIDFECDRWSELSMGQGYLKWLLQPKLFQQSL